MVEPVDRPPATAEEHPGGDALAVDDADADSAVSIPTLSVESLRSSVLEYQKENGRTYHSMSSGKYAYPNDEAEIERLEIQHNLWLLTLRGALALCPKADTAKRVLDAGTGSGVWAIDYADTHPEAEVIGVDLSPIQPSTVPPNCTFEVDDLEKDWTWAKPFDLILSRVMAGSFSDYEDYIKKAYDALEPGGYLELQDIHAPFSCDDDTMAGTQTEQLGNLFLEASLALGRPLNVAPTYKDIMKKVGFVDIVEKPLKWPLGIWPKDKHFKEVGYWYYMNLEVGLEGLLMALLTRGLGWTKEEVMVFCAKVRPELKNPKIHAYLPIYVVYGRKPGGDSAAE
ncbi:hypothetical protein VUR80DRAFT_7981 [Thermomyces stellatus]